MCVFVTGDSSRRMRHVTSISLPFSARCAYFPSPRGCTLIPFASCRSPSPPPSPLESTLAKVYQNRRLQLPLESPTYAKTGGGGVIVNEPRPILGVLCAPVSVPSVFLPAPTGSGRQIPCSQQLAASLSLFCALFRTPFLCFQ